LPKKENTIAGSTPASAAIVALWCRRSRARCPFLVAHAGEVADSFEVAFPGRAGGEQHQELDRFAGLVAERVQAARR
jgi:hypothetical protein